jgi:hypothetical protein
MKQLSINFEKRKNQKVTPERIKKVCELINAGATPREAIAVVRMGAGYTKLLIEVGIIKKVGKNEWKAVEKLHQSTYNEFIRLKQNYNQVTNQKAEPVKKAVALPWWKRILLYLANR